MNSIRLNPGRTLRGTYPKNILGGLLQEAILEKPP
jgi:hypothetical protein